MMMGISFYLFINDKSFCLNLDLIIHLSMLFISGFTFFGDVLK